MKPKLRPTVGAFVVCALVLGTPDSSAQENGRVFCGDPQTGEELMKCLARAMPKADSGIYERPSAQQMAAWRGVIRQMLEGSCEAIPVPAELEGYEIRRFLDQSTGRDYCLLLEVGDANQDGVVDRGWGTFIWNGGAARELVHAAPHPINDEGTVLEATQIARFSETNSRAFLLAGTHRNASRTPSRCQADRTETDVAHDVDNMYFATLLELQAFYGNSPWAFFAWHEMPERICPGVDAYITYGLSEPPPRDSSLVRLRDEMREDNPDWTVNVPGDEPRCRFHGRNSVDGRLLNGVAAAQVCETGATQPSRRFFHVEQQQGHAEAAAWSDAIEAVFPASNAAETLTAPADAAGPPGTRRR